jgi:F-type H+-transporting ATPase subunit a
MTFALAITTVIMVQIWGVRAQGGAYFSKFANASGENAAMKGISVFVSFLEIVSEFARIIAFGFRLFGNIFAGEVVLATMAFLIPFFLPLPFYALEIFVGVIQALVFMMLALVFFTMATISHGHEEHGDSHAQGTAHGTGHGDGNLVDEPGISEAQVVSPPVA